MKDIKDLFTSEGLLEKKAGVWVNKAGIFNFSPADGPDMLRHFADLTSRLGMEIAGLKEPLIGTSRENAVTMEIVPDLADGPVVEICCGGLLIKGTDHAQLAEAVRGIVTGSAGQEREPGEYDTYKNVAPRLDLNEDVRVLWSDDWALDPEAALVFFTRTAMDGFRAAYPYAVDEDGAEGVRYLRKCPEDPEKAGGRIEFTDSGDIAVRCSYPAEFRRLASGYAGALQSIKDIKGDYWLEDLENIASGKNDLGQMASVGTDAAGAELITFENSRAEVAREKWSVISGVGLKRHNDPKEIRRWEYEEEWEGETFLKALKDALKSVRPGSKVDVEGLLSEDLDVRRELQGKACDLILEAGAVPGDVRIYRSFKSGISWIEEKVMPELKALGGLPDKLEIEFRYFMNERGDDGFEEESIPNYGVYVDNPDKWFDIPTRWLQELHPVDELIEKELGIPKEAVEFRRYDGEDFTYRLRAFREGSEVWSGEFTTAYVKKHYMEKYPLVGWTHVSTGRLSVAADGEKICETRIATDMEKMWDHLENEILPGLEEYILSKYPKEDLPAMQPLFGRLDIALRMSEMDLDIGIRNERISMLESMQEDIYFFLLDWFKTFGERECGAPLDNVGLIFPKPENGKGLPSVMSVVLSEEIADAAALIKDGTTIPVRRTPCRAKLSGLAFKGDGSPIIDIRMEPEDPEDAKEIRDRLTALAGFIDTGIAVYPASRDLDVRVSMDGWALTARIPEYRRKEPDLTEEERQDILRHRVVDYPTYMRLLDYYAAIPGLRVIPIGTTYKGLKLYAIELVRKPEGISWSRYKLMNSRITALFNARHHGNESTSLNSGFMLIDCILQDPELDALMNGLNIITIPWENVDGGVMHCEIYEKHPNWLAHIARYNSCGFEIRKDYDNLDTKYGECRVVREIWEKWLPDIVTDNHGFEGHEMCQPFSGYISPWYKSFWIPRALYYGYIWYNPNIAHLESFGTDVRERVTRAITSDPDIHAWNDICRDRFDKYARNWFPELFASPKHNDVVFYWMDTSVHPRNANFAIAHPEITVIDWTTEVADETVTGEDFYLNAKAHLISDLALLDVIKETPTKVDCRPDGDGLIKIRHKPLYTE